MSTDSRTGAKAKSFGENIESDLALEMLRVVENAAIESARTMGMGERKLADQVATEPGPDRESRRPTSAPRR